MMIHVVVCGPQPVERRYCDDNPSARLQDGGGALDQRVRTRNVLEDVEHQNQIEWGGRGVRGVELADRDAAAPGLVSLRGGRIRFDALHIAESRERVEEQAGTTADVENPGRPARAQ